MRTCINNNPTNAQRLIIGRIYCKKELSLSYGDYTENTDPNYGDHMDSDNYSVHVGSDGEF